MLRVLRSCLFSHSLDPQRPFASIDSNAGPWFPARCDRPCNSQVPLRRWPRSFSGYVPNCIATTNLSELYAPIVLGAHAPTRPSAAFSPLAKSTALS